MTAREKNKKLRRGAKWKKQKMRKKRKRGRKKGKRQNKGRKGKQGRKGKIEMAVGEKKIVATFKSILKMHQRRSKIQKFS